MAEENNSDKIIESQLKLFQFIITALGLFIVLSFGVVGFFQIRSANEVSAAADEIKKESTANLKYFMERLDNSLPRYDERFDRLEQNVNSRVDGKLKDMNDRFNELTNLTPDPRINTLFRR